MENALKILHEHKLKATPIRKAVLATLKQAERGLSRHDLNRLIEVSYDRSTLFRALNTFEEKGILHKVISEEGVTKYAFTQQQNKSTASDHAHFYCIRCKSIFCLDYTVALANIPVPENFKKEGVEMQVRGTCSQCLLKNRNH